MAKRQIRAEASEALASDEEGSTITELLGDGWVVDFFWARGFHRGGPTRITVRAQADKKADLARGITSDVLRSVPLAQALEKVQLIRPHVESFERRVAGLKETVRVGRAGREDLFYARLAREYLRLLDEGARAPIRALAEAYGVSVETMRARIKEARSGRALIAGPPGRQADRLTAKAQRLLDAADDSERGVS